MFIFFFQHLFLTCEYYKRICGVLFFSLDILCGGSLKSYWISSKRVYVNVLACAHVLVIVICTIAVLHQTYSFFTKRKKEETKEFFLVLHLFINNKNIALFARYSLNRFCVHQREFFTNFFFRFFVAKFSDKIRINSRK